MPVIDKYSLDRGLSVYSMTPVKIQFFNKMLLKGLKNVPVITGKRAGMAKVRYPFLGVS